jgi:RNA polymerase sigma factor (sigma-70 family)
MGTDAQGEWNQHTADLIRYKVRKMFPNACGYTKEDREDKEQDLWVQITLGMRRFDPSRASRRTFSTRIVNSKINTLMDHDRAQKRDRGRRSADLPEGLSDPHQHPSDTDRRLDVSAALESLSPRDQSVAALLDTFTIAGIARKTGLSRQQVRTSRDRIANQLAHLKDEQPTSEPLR